MMMDFLSAFWATKSDFPSLSGEVSLGLNAPNMEDEGAQAELGRTLRSFARAVACEEGDWRAEPPPGGCRTHPFPSPNWGLDSPGTSLSSHQKRGSGTHWRGLSLAAHTPRACAGTALASGLTLHPHFPALRGTEAPSEAVALTLPAHPPPGVALRVTSQATSEHRGTLGV